MPSQRLDLETRGGERSAPRQHNCSLKIGELKSVGARQGLAALGSLKSPRDLNGGFTNILAWEKRPVSCRRSVGTSKDEPFETLRQIDHHLPASRSRTRR